MERVKGNEAAPSSRTYRPVQNPDVVSTGLRAVRDALFKAGFERAGLTVAQRLLLWRRRRLKGAA